jgi:hypothetical protein
LRRPGVPGRLSRSSTWGGAAVFIRILRGQAFDGAATLAEVNRWRQELGAGVLGWRRLTAGIGDGGELVVALRYDTEAAARRDRDRPELAAW